MRNFIQRLQKLITDYNSLLNQKELNFKDENVFRDFHAMIYVAKVFTFLKKNGFLSEQNFRSTFQDHTFWREAIYYYYKAFMATNKYLGGTEEDVQYQSGRSQFNFNGPTRKLEMMKLILVNLK
jgi:hypothetical protein